MPTPRNKHETKPEQAAGFKGSYEPSSRDNPKWRVGDGDRAPLPVEDHSPQIDLTGRWIDEEGGFYLFINHVRGHIELLLACVESGSSGIYNDKPRDKERSETRLIRMGGEQRADDDPTFELYLRLPGVPLDDNSYICGALTGSDETILLQLDGNMSQPRIKDKVWKRLNRYSKRIAKRLDSEPCLFPHHLCVDGVSAEERSSYWFSPTPIQLRKLPDFILDARIRVAENYAALDRKKQASGLGLGYVELVHDYFRLQDGSLGKDLHETKVKAYQKNILRSLDELVLIAFQESQLIPAEQGGIDSFGEDDWSVCSLESLYETKIEAPGLPKGKRSLVELTQLMLDACALHDLQNFARRLYMGPTLGGHYYGAHIAIGDVSSDEKARKKTLGKVLARLGKHAGKAIKRLMKLPVGALLMLIEVRKEEDPELVPESQRKPPEWIGYYYAVLYGLGRDWGLNVGRGTVVEADGAARNVYGQPWLPEQLAGRVRFQDLGVSAKVGPFGFGGGLTLLTMFGSGKSCPPTPLQLNFTGASKVFGSGASANFSGKRYRGQARMLSAENGFMPEKLEAPKYELEYSGDSATAPLHFPINGARPMGHAERMLETLAANELVALSSETCEIELHGYADQPGTEIKNLILSRNRAISVYNYLKSICYGRMRLGELSEVPPEDQEIEKYEQEQEEGGSPSVTIPTEASEHVSIVAHGESSTPSSGKPKDHNSSYRRVDITVNEGVSLSLRRRQDD